MNATASATTREVTSSHSSRGRATEFSSRSIKINLILQGKITTTIRAWHAWTQADPGNLADKHADHQFGHSMVYQGELRRPNYSSSSVGKSGGPDTWLICHRQVTERGG